MQLFRKKCKNRKCGKEFMGTRTQQYCCPECRQLPDSKLKKKVISTKSKETKKKNVQTIDEIAIKARELGMTYGKYIEMLTIEEQRKERMKR